MLVNYVLKTYVYFKMHVNFKAAYFSVIC